MGLQNFITDSVRQHGYPALFGLIVLENLFPPIPSELILPLAGYYVDQEILAFAPVIVASTLGSLVGALIIYAIARWGGRPVLLRFGRVLRVTEESLDVAEARFARHGSAIVFFGRLIPGIRSIVSLPAGLARMPIARFVALTTVGSALWNTLLVGLGWWLGSAYADVEHVVGPMSRIVLVLLILGIVAWALTAMRRRRAANGH